MLNNSQTQVMGILNITPDSFFDGGNLYREGLPDLNAILHQAEQMANQGADWLDLGGESTRPGADPVTVQEELDRIVPVVESIKAELDVSISVDTSTPEVMREAVKAGAKMINDVRALSRPGALSTAAELGVPVCLMHMLGQPDNMQQDPQYQDVVGDVTAFLQDRVQIAIESGVRSENIIIDPGFGFGKALAHNLALFNALPQFVAMGYPVLVGVSRKSMIGAILDKPAEQRLQGSTSLALLAAQAGAALLRVHDVAETVDVLKILAALSAEREE